MVRLTIDDIQRKNVNPHDVKVVFVLLCDLYDFWNAIMAVFELGSRRKECEASSVESADQVLVPEVVGDHQSARFPHSVRTSMASWSERQHQVHVQRTPNYLFTFTFTYAF